MKLVDQWRTIAESLPSDWEAVRLVVTTEEPGDLARAAQVLGPMSAGKSGGSLVINVRRAGGGQGPEAVRRLFNLLDESRTWARLEQGEVSQGHATAPVSEEPEITLSESWQAALAALPPDWTDLLGEIELDSSDYLDRTALLCAPLNPTRDRSRLVFRFRSSGRAGYGASRGMVQRCFERLDAEGITGVARVVRMLADADNVDTQGPVWLVGGKML